MANPANWTELCSSIASWMIRDDQTDRIPEYISLAETRLDRAIASPDRDELTTLSAAASVTLPADFGGVNALWIETSPRTSPDPVSLGELRQLYPDSATGIPGNYAISGGKIYFGPAPDSAYSVSLSYRKALTPLSEDNATNWLLTLHPDLYLAACLTEAFLGVYDDQRAGQWDARTAAKIEEVNKAGRQKRYGGTPQRIRSPVVV